MSESLPRTDHPAGRASPPRPALVVFDVNETLSDMGPLGSRFEEIGVPGHVAQLWFAELLRDGFALAAAGSIGTFAALGSEVLRGRLAGHDLDRGIDEAVEHVLAGFSELQVHPDVADGVRALSELGIRLVTLSNGSSAVAEGLLTGAGLRDRFERLLTVEDAGAWKPAPGAYAYALDQCGVEAGDAMLVAVHPWDVDGARRAGLRAAWVSRAAAHYPSYFTAPDLTVASLPELAEALR